MTPTLKDLEDLTFNPFEAEIFEYGDVSDPYSILENFRQISPVAKQSLHSTFMSTENKIARSAPGYMILGYDDVYNAFTHPQWFSNEILKDSIGLSFGLSLSTMDGDFHARYRRIFQKAFLPTVVSAWGEKVIQPVIDDLLDQFEGSGKADLLTQFTRRYPFSVIYRQLGLPSEVIERFQKIAVTQTLYRSYTEHAIDAGKKLGEFFSDLIDCRMQDPKDDLITYLANTEVDGERLPREVLVSFLRQLMNAGGDTTYRGTSNILVGLLTNPDQLLALKSDRTLMPQVIEEGLRWEGPVMAMPRLAAADVEIAGVMIERGSPVDLVIGSANRDPTKYPQPEKFDVFRERNTRPIPFGTGPHVCLGQHLARVEITRALNTLLDRLPNLRLDPDMPVPVIRGYHLRKPEHVYVNFDPK